MQVLNLDLRTAAISVVVVSKAVGVGVSCQG
jgi:hypothetical protein